MAGAKVKAHDFFQGLFTVDLAPEEIIAAVQFTPIKAPPTPSSTSARRTSPSSASPRRWRWAAARFRSARVGLTGATPHAIRLTAVEQALAGKPATTETVRAAAASAGVD